MKQNLKEKNQTENVDTYDFDHELKEIQINLFSFIFSTLHKKCDALDVLQETNLVIYKKKGEFNPKLGKLKTWAFRIARFQIMAFLTKRKRNRLSFNSEVVEQVMDQAETYCMQNQDLQKRALESCYKDLPEHMAIIAELWYKKDKSMKEISKITGRSIGAVSSTMHRMRQSLTKCAKRKINQYEVYGGFENE